MVSLASLFTYQRVQGMFDILPEHGWEQRAPHLGDKLTFNYEGSNRMSKLRGVMILGRSAVSGGLEVTYRTRPKMRGFVVSGVSIDTQPYNTLLLRDTSPSNFSLDIADDDTLRPNGLNEQQVELIGGLLAQSVIDAYDRFLERKNEHIDIELRRILDSTA